jgi:hypothetical protein
MEWIEAEATGRCQTDAPGMVDAISSTLTNGFQRGLIPLFKGGKWECNAMSPCEFGVAIVEVLG